MNWTYQDRGGKLGCNRTIVQPFRRGETLVIRILICMAAIAVLAAPASAQATDRWEIELSDASIMYEVRPVRVERDALVVQQGDSAVRLPITRVTVLRRFVKSVKHGAGGAYATFAGVIGADDQVFQLTLLTPDERRAKLEEILRRLAAETTRAAR